MQIIKREYYLEKLRNLRDKQIIKILTGVRRCGKSTLLQMFIDEIKSQGVNEDEIISINLEDYENISLRNPDTLHRYISSMLSKDKMTYIFIDEIQHVERYADVIDSLFIKPNTDIYVTGSNAYMLSSEIATLLSGRYVEIKVTPLSFKEYASACNDHTSLQDIYIDYVSYGSFPYIVNLRDNKTVISDYIEGIYNTIVMKDVIQRGHFNDSVTLESVIKFVADNIGNIFSTKKVADTLSSYGRKTDVKTVEKYLKALTESFIIYKVPRYNIKGRQLLKTLEKYYLVDVALRKYLLGTKTTDVGHILENVVYLELLRRHKQVYIGKVDTLEIDFIATDENQITYYQVSASVRDENTLKRELAPLKAIKDSYPKFLLTLDDDPEEDYEGIKKLNAVKWLSGS